MDGGLVIDGLVTVGGDGLIIIGDVGVTGRVIEDPFIGLEDRVRVGGREDRAQAPQLDEDHPHGEAPEDRHRDAARVDQVAVQAAEAAPDKRRGTACPPKPPPW